MRRVSTVWVLMALVAACSYGLAAWCMYNRHFRLESDLGRRYGR